MSGVTVYRWLGRRQCTAQRMSGALLYFLEISPSCLSMCERTE
jgi:hypothetical protein